MAVQKLDHLGIIVNDLDQAIKQYETVLGIPLDHIEDYGNGLLKIAFLPLGDIKIELIQPLKPGSSAWEFLKKNGEGIEHIAFQVNNLNEELGRIIEQKIPVQDRKPKKGAGNTDISFLYSEALCGVLGEFVSYKK